MLEIGNIFDGGLLRNIFKTLLVIVVIMMAGYWYQKFDIEDRDIGVVDYVSVDEAFDIELPTVSLCFIMPFLESKIKEFDPESSSASYLQYLKGHAFESHREYIDYSNATFDLNDYLTESHVKKRNESEINKGSFLFKHAFSGFEEFGDFQKCYELASDKEKLLHQAQFISLRFDKGELYTDFNSTDLSISINFHLPGEYLLRSANSPFRMRIEGNSESLMVVFSDIEIIKSRNSKNRICTPDNDVKSFDAMVLEEHVKKFGCAAPYLKSLNTGPVCRGQNAIKDSSYKYEAVRKRYIPISCRRLSKLDFTHQITHDDNIIFLALWQTWTLSIVYPEYVRIISQSKDVDIHTLIGNIGGYVGLFLGK